MNIVITGGGTGGHVFPALEVARQAVNNGWNVVFLGSLHGQEKKLCHQCKINFTGFNSTAFYPITTLRGIKARIKFISATAKAQKVLSKIKPDILFSTGGYSSAPVMSAAKRLKIPYVLHEQNSIPGRTNIIFSKSAQAVTTVFDSTRNHFSNSNIIRTGMPVRSKLVEVSNFLYHPEKAEEHSESEFLTTELKHELNNIMLNKESPLIFVMGGSQGAIAINDLVLTTVLRMSTQNIRWLHVTGPKNFENISYSADKLGLGSHYTIKAYLEEEDVAKAFAECDLFIGRSGASTMAEVALFRKPAIYIPYPSAFNNHQYHNAKELEEAKACTVIEQKKLQPVLLEQLILNWLHNISDREKAFRSLSNWDIKDAALKVILLLERLTLESQRQLKTPYAKKI